MVSLRLRKTLEICFLKMNVKKIIICIFYKINIYIYITIIYQEVLRFRKNFMYIFIHNYKMKIFEYNQKNRKIFNLRYRRSLAQTSRLTIKLYKTK